jgi:hypothetical protein
LERHNEQHYETISIEYCGKRQEIDCKSSDNARTTEASDDDAFAIETNGDDELFWLK